MAQKLALLASTMAALASVMVDGAVIPTSMPSDLEVARSAGPKPIVLAPYKPKKKSPIMATVALASTKQATPAKPKILRTSETLYWYSDGHYASATLKTVDEKRKIVSVDSWDDMITSLDCPSNSDITITFNDNISVDNVHSQLGWVNEDEENNFIFVTDEECGGEDGRQPYLIKNLEVSTTTGQITLKGQPAEWESLGVESTLHISTEPFGVFLEDDSEGSLVKRGSGFLDMATDFSGTTLYEQEIEGVRLALTCAECKLTGGLNWDLGFNKNIFSDDFGPEGQLSTANNFGARFALGVKASGALVDGIPLLNQEIVAIPLSPISLGKIAKFTPQITVNAVASISAITAEVEAKFGAAMTVPDGTTLRIGDDSDEIKPNFEMIGPEVKGKVSVGAVLTPLVTLDITAEVFSKGATVGFGLEAPALDAKLAIETNSEGVCGNPHGLLGLSGSVGVGANLNFFYGVGEPKDQPNKIGLLNYRHELWGECLVVAEKPVEVPETPTESPTGSPAESPTETHTELPTESPTELPTATPVEPPVETPTETTIIETPVVETPIIYEPVTEAPDIYNPVITTPTTPTPALETPIVEAPSIPSNGTLPGVPIDSPVECPSAVTRQLRRGTRISESQYE